MRQQRARRAASVLVLAGLVAGAAGCGDDGGGSSSFVGLQRTPPLEVGAVSLPDVTESEPGTPRAMKADPGGLMVVYFGFTNCPDLCPTTLSALRSARRRIGPEADVVGLTFVTVDPERDTAEVIRLYASSYVDGAVVMRTTDPEELAAAQAPFLASSAVVKGDDGKVDVSHTATAYVVDERGTVLIEWPFGIGPEGMANDLQLLLDDLKENPT